MLGLSRLAGFQASDRLSGKPTFLGKTASRSGFLSTEVQGRPLPSHPPAAGLIGTRRSGAHRAGGSAQLPKKGQLSTFCSLETNWTAGLGRGAREDAGRALPQPCPQPCPPRGRGARWGGAERSGRGSLGGCCGAGSAARAPPALPVASNFPGEGWPPISTTS